MKKRQLKKKHSGTVVIELNHRGIPDEELKPEEFDDHQLAVLAALAPELQEKIRQGCPFSVVDLETDTCIAQFNIKNVKPSESERDDFLRMLIRAMEEQDRMRNETKGE